MRTSRRLWLGFGTLTLLIFVTGFSISLLLSSLENDVQRLTRVAEPTPEEVLMAQRSAVKALASLQWSVKALLLAGLLVAVAVSFFVGGDVARTEQTLRVTLTTIGDAVITTDPEGRVTFLNPVAQSLTGWKEDEAAGQPLQSVFRIASEQTREALEDPVALVVGGSASAGAADHTVLLGKDGAERIIDQSAAPIRDLQGDLIGVVLIFRDVTDRWRAEREVQRHFERERAHTDRLHQVAAASLTLNSAHSPESVVGVVQEESRRIFDVRQAVATLDQEAPPLAPGSLAVPLLGRNGRGLGYLRLSDKFDGGFTEDDEALLTLLANMAAVALENARLYEELRQGNQRKNEFLATLAHELRNPLAPIRNSLEVLRRAGPEGPALAQARDTMTRQLRHLVRLVDDLLDISRITRGRIELRLEHVELARVVESALETSRPDIDRFHQRLTVRLPSKPVWMYADATRVAQVLANLLNNAARYTPDGGGIWLTADRDNGHVVVRVRDTGIGLSAAMLPRVFDIFAQADPGLDRTEGGLGIGLTLVKSLVDMHSGTVEARSAGVGQGTEFIVRLPVGSEGRPRPVEAEPAPPVSAPASRRILVVDDNLDTVESLALLLHLMGHEVHTAGDGPSALEAALADPPDLVLLDIGLPGMNGYEVAVRIRKQPELKDTILVAITGWGQEEDRRRAREAGFDHHLTKPADPAVLQKLLADVGVPPSRQASERPQG